jgi:CDP-diacylglycerol pyrophosphatase
MEDYCNRPDDVDSRLDALTHKARIAIQIQPSERQVAIQIQIACRRSTVRTAIPNVQNGRSLIWKLLAADVRPSGRQCLIVRTRLSNMKDFQQKSQNFCHTIVRPDGSRIYQSSRPFEPLAYK